MQTNIHLDSFHNDTNIIKFCKNESQIGKEDKTNLLSIEYYRMKGFHMGYR